MLGIDQSVLHTRTIPPQPVSACSSAVQANENRVSGRWEMRKLQAIVGSASDALPGHHHHHHSRAAAAATTQHRRATRHARDGWRSAIPGSAGRGGGGRERQQRQRQRDGSAGDRRNSGLGSSCAAARDMPSIRSPPRGGGHRPPRCGPHQLDFPPYAVLRLPSPPRVSPTF